MKTKHNPDYYMTVEHAALNDIKISPPRKAIYKWIAHGIIKDQIKQLRKYRKI